MFASTSGVDREQGADSRRSAFYRAGTGGDKCSLTAPRRFIPRYAYDIPLTIAKDITLGDVTVNAASDYAQSGGASVICAGIQTSTAMVPAATG